MHVSCSSELANSDAVLRCYSEPVVPIVGAPLSSKASAVKRMSSDDLPTPESPTKRTCEHRNQLIYEHVECSHSEDPELSFNAKE